MLLEEPRHDVRTKCEGYTPIVLAPASNVLIGIGPEQVAKKTAVGNLSSLAGEAQGFREPGRDF